MHRRRSLLVVIPVLLGALLALSDAGAQQRIVIKFSHVVAVDTPKGKGAEQFGKLAGERTRGRVEFEVFDLPFVFDDHADLRKVTDGPVGAALLKKLEGKGSIGLAYRDNGLEVMSANRPLRIPEDMKGLEMRIQPSKVMGDRMPAPGAIPPVMAFSGVCQAMQTGVVDGSENAPSNMYTQKHHEVRKFTAVTNHGYIGYAVIASRKFRDGLPPDIRTTLEGAMAGATRLANDIAQKENDEALEGIRQSGRTEVITLTREQKAAWKMALVSAHREHESRVGKETLEAVYRRTGFKP